MENFFQGIFFGALFLSKDMSVKFYNTFFFAIFFLFASLKKLKTYTSQTIFQ